MERVRASRPRSSYARVNDGAVLRTLRDQHGYSVYDVARFVETTGSYVSKVERGEARTVSPVFARRLMLLYGQTAMFHLYFTLCHTDSRKAA